MKVSAMIELLNDFMDEHGNLDVMMYDALNGSIREHNGPKLRYTRVMMGRESLVRLFGETSDPPERRGAQVCLL